MSPPSLLPSSARATAAKMHRAQEVTRAIGRGMTLALVLGIAALLVGCTAVSRGTIDTVRLAWRGAPKLAPTAQAIAAKPYYQLRATMAHGDAVLILGNMDGQREYWYGKDCVVVVLQHGRVVQTAGLPQNLDGSRVTGNADPFEKGLQTQRHSDYERADDWSPGYRYGVPVRAELARGEETLIDILGTTHRVVMIREAISSKVAGFRASNTYWVDPTDGFVWMSEQEFMPGVTIKLVELQPYRGGKS